MTTRILCPFCQEKGKTEVLAELNEDGEVVVQRYRSGNDRKVTAVNGKDFYLTCKVCNEMVFLRNK